MEDEQIISLYFDRNEEAIRQTDIKYGALCYKVAYNILNSPTDSEECVNDTYLGIWNAIPPTRPKFFRNFICRIVRNVSIKCLERRTAKKRGKEVEVSLSELEDILPDNSIRVDVQDDHLGNIISDFLMELNKDERDVFVKKYWFFESVKEIAGQFNFSESKVKQTLYRTREKLKTHLIKEGVRI